jgi:hypothetical protein
VTGGTRLAGPPCIGQDFGPHNVGPGGDAWALVLDCGRPGPGNTGGRFIMVDWQPAMADGPWCSRCAGLELNERNASGPLPRPHAPALQVIQQLMWEGRKTAVRDPDEVPRTQVRTISEFTRRSDDGPR